MNSEGYIHRRLLKIIIMKTFIKYNLFIVSLIFCFTPTQEVKSQDFGADVVSSYVWRGSQFGTGPHVQPWMELGAGGFSGGIWGSFGLNSDSSGNELDLWASYDFGPLALTVTNYSFPGGDGKYPSDSGVFDGDIEVSGSASLGPIDLTVGYFTDLESLYIEAGFSAGPIDIALGYGSDGDGTTTYAGGDSGLVNLSVGGSKDIKITDDYSLPVFGSFIYNADAEAAFLVFGASF